ncbi:SRPBCC domain-containing protein [Kitasatospora sp. NPDC101176]|uniref:SRPBCC family protein n=1 Tax=Kitasatospora sp. NPDC101176 TaxID=3364099 RepID=UPI003828CFFE
MTERTEQVATAGTTAPAGKAVINREEFLPFPPARVWEALTVPEQLARWWVPGNVKPEVGHRFTLDMGPFGHTPCEVLAVEPERLISYTFAEGELDTTVTWRLVPEEGGTRLLLENAGFDLETPIGRQAYQGMGEKGWPRVFGRLAPALAG